MASAFGLFACSESEDPSSDGDADTDTGTGADGDADGDADTEGVGASPLLSLITDTEDYVGWDQGNDSWGPGTTPPELTDTHPGWNAARCFECHAEGTPWVPAGHDTRMQYWPWSCARGFPGGACHGHGVNNGIMFNHGGSSYFFDCTRSGCHTELNAPSKFTENHGMSETPDVFCLSCHQYGWTGWPDETATK